MLDPNRTMMGAAPTVGNVDLNRTQTIKPVQCPVCKTFNPAGLFFCSDCGLIFERALPGDAFGAPAIQLPLLVDSSGKEYPLRPGKTVLGREGDIMVADGRISRRHATITSENGKFVVEDLNSTNGTFFGKARLNPGETRELAPGEKFSLGGFEFQLQLPGGPSGNATQTFTNSKTQAMAAAPQKESAPAKLVSPDQEFGLKAGKSTFGRKDGNDLVLADPYVSGKHGEIEVTTDGVFITDIGSSNGTVLNDAPLVKFMRTRMEDGDVITLGSLKLTLKVS